MGPSEEAVFKGHRTGSGIGRVPKLKYEHVNLTSFSKMRVDLAAQVIVCSFVSAEFQSYI